MLELLFSLGQKLGYNITPNRYDSPIPDLKELQDDLWFNRSELVGINVYEEKQLELLSYFESRFKSEYDSLPRHQTTVPYEYYVGNGTFESIDGEVLYCMIRHLKPSKIVEVGSGFSTYLMAQTVSINRAEDDKYACDLIAIEPYPNPTLKKGFPGLSKLVNRKVQSVPLSQFSQLSENDVLFIDSSHALKTGSDVQYLYLEILPRLRKGVVIHVHDIFLPAEYPKTLLFDFHLFYNEQYILQAFLAFNNSFEVLWAGNYMHSNHADRLKRAFSSYDLFRSYERGNVPWIGPGSFWIKKVK
jgi:predicted O-methyltransferase YrrM